MGSWILISTATSWGMNFKGLWIIMANPPVMSSSSKMVTQNTSKKTKKWLEDHEFEVMRWPAQSPDLNPIEHLWHYIKSRLWEYEEPPNSIQTLWERVQVEWDKIPAKVCQDLIESMPRRGEAVFKAKGGYTKY